VTGTTERHRGPSPHTVSASGDRYVEDLEKLPPRSELRAHYPLIKGPVDTDYDPGHLWQVSSNQVGVVLDSDPEVMTCMDPFELVLLGVSA
jgi:hypothetical protein